MIGAGGVLLFVESSREVTPPNGTLAANPSGAVAPFGSPIRRQHFTAYLKSIAEGADDGETSAAQTLLASLVEEWDLNGAGVRIRLKNRRVFQSGHEYDSEAVFTCRDRGEFSEASIEIVGGSGPRRAFPVRFQSGKLFFPETGQSPDSSQKSWAEVSAKLPVGIGDLDIRDTFGIYNSLRDRISPPVGFIKTPNGVKLLVFDLNLMSSGGQSRDLTEAGPERYDDTAGSALFYVKVPDPELRAVRVFDQEGRLLRTYEDFRFKSSDSKMRHLEAFRATSVLTASHTALQILSVEPVQ
jgi:hypothetical protein